jgi:hypothetical protein
MVVFAMGAGASYAATLGLSAAMPAFSAKQIKLNDPAAGDGIYWIDPTGGDTSDAFQIIADMTTAGGGWTLGLQSLNDSSVATTDMVANTGTVGPTTGHTRDMTELALSQNAQLRHRLVQGGSVIFDGYYTGTYHGTFGGVSDWTVLSGDLDVIEFHFDRPWSTADNDVDTFGGGNCAEFFGNTPWYYKNCWWVHPGYAARGPVTNAGNASLDSYQIYVRESVTPDLSAIPIPAPLALLGGGLLALGALRRRT